MPETDLLIDRPIPFPEYLSTDGLSYSAMKDLSVSPFRFWYNHINPNRPVIEPSAEMWFGTALHCAVLEPSKFADRFACEIAAEDFEGCLVTMDDLRTFLKDRGFTPKGTRKAEMVAQVQYVDPNWPILDVLLERHAAETSGKVTFKKFDWSRIASAAISLREEPNINKILNDQDGRAEVSMFVTDPETGVRLKARMDWITPGLTLDLKTFSQKRVKSIDQSVADAIFYEGYHKQAFHYAVVRGWPKSWAGDHVIAFVESEEPHEVRIKALRPKSGGQPNLYWERGRVEVRQLIRLYAECIEQFGDKPWRYAQEICPLADEEIRGLAY